MSDENKKQSTEEIIEEIQSLMKRQMELQAELLQTNWNSFGDALGAFMQMMNGGNASPNREEAKSKKEDGDES